MSYFCEKFWSDSLGPGIWNLDLSMGPTPSLFLRLFLIKNALIPKTYLSWLVVVRFLALKKQIDENLVSERLE